MKILIVEDDTLLLQGLILAAQTEGYACDGVSTAGRRNTVWKQGITAWSCWILGCLMRTVCTF